MNTQITLLSHNALDGVVGGGTSCATGLAVAAVYLNVAKVIGALGGGSPSASGAVGRLTGLAEGITQGTCPA